MDSIDEKELNAFKKDKLFKIILDLQRKVEELTLYKLIENRIVKLEKNHFSQLQYERRDTIEIDGIPVSVPHEEVEEAALAVLGKIGVDCCSDEVQACHRLNKKGTVIMKFVNRKKATAALSNRKRLRDMDKWQVAGDTIKLKMDHTSPPEKVQHINDLVLLGLASGEDVEKFYAWLLQKSNS